MCVHGCNPITTVVLIPVITPGFQNRQNWTEIVGLDKTEYASRKASSSQCE